MAPAPPDSSSESSPKRLIGSDTVVSDSASGSARSVSGLRSSSVSCRRSRLTLFAYSWVPHFVGGQKSRPNRCTAWAAAWGSHSQRKLRTATRTAADKSATQWYHFSRIRQLFPTRPWLVGLARRWDNRSTARRRYIRLFRLRSRLAVVRNVRCLELRF